MLLVDDHRFIGLALERLFATESDIQLHCCEKADDAISRANAIKPAIILQDLVMPGIDGLALVALYRQNAATASTPIIVLSGNEDAGSRERSITAGANDYLLKLPAKDVLLACIRKYADPRSPAVTPASPATPGSSGDVRGDETLDREVIAVFCDRDGGLSSFARALIEQFLCEAEAQIATMKNAAGARDTDLLKMNAHSLKGSSMTVGAKRLGGLCRTLEQDVEKHPEQSVAETHIAAIAEEFVLVRKALSSL